MRANLQYAQFQAILECHIEMPLMTTAADNEIQYNADSGELVCHGNWDLAHLSRLQALFSKLSFDQAKSIIINGKAIEKMDSAGAWLLDKWQRKLDESGKKITFADFSEPHQSLIDIIQKELETQPVPPQRAELNAVATVGKNSILQVKAFGHFLDFVGRLSAEACTLIFKPKHIRWSSLVSVIYSTGFQALPIIALLSFMIGVVLTYQMGLQLKSYGANVFIVNLLGLAVLREFAPLLTAIMVAGRTGSAYTAQLGMMKLNQEIDALDTMGITPGELLLLPRILGLVIALPLLTIWSDIFGIVGGMVMSNKMLNISWYDFLHRFPHVIPLKTLLIGLGKAPVFALIIASVGCFQGMNVELSADSVGKNTTRSVVLAIFFIIVADAAFSIILSMLKL